MDERYAELAAANFNLVLGGFGADRPITASRQIAICEKYGMKALVHCHGVRSEEFPDGRACWGYSVRDEPGVSSFLGLRNEVDRLRAVCPGKLAFIKLFPNYAPSIALGVTTYNEYVARFCGTVGPDVLSMDPYPRFKPSVDKRARDAYCDNLAIMRKYSLQYGITHYSTV